MTKDEKMKVIRQESKKYNCQELCTYLNLDYLSEKMTWYNNNMKVCTLRGQILGNRSIDDLYTVFINL